MVWLALAVGFVGGVIATGALAHNCPSLFINPKKYFWKLWLKVEAEAEKLEGEAKERAEELLAKLTELIKNWEG